MTQSRQMTPRAQLALIAIMVMLRGGFKAGERMKKSGQNEAPGKSAVSRVCGQPILRVA